MAHEDYSVYACNSCTAWHRQLFLLEHDYDCQNDENWHVTTRSKAYARQHDLCEYCHANPKEPNFPCCDNGFCKAEFFKERDNAYRALHSP